jgi:hypothetical protein
MQGKIIVKRWYKIGNWLLIVGGAIESEAEFAVLCEDLKKRGLLLEKIGDTLKLKKMVEGAEPRVMKIRSNGWSFMLPDIAVIDVTRKGQSLYKAVHGTMRSVAHVMELTEQKLRRL